MSRYYLAWLLILLAAVGTAVAYPDMPATMPTHWGPGGDPDRYGPKAIALFIVPALMIFMTILFWLLPKLERANTKKRIKESALSSILMVLLLGLFALQVFIIGYGYGFEWNLSTVLGPIIGLLFVAIGNYMPRLGPKLSYGPGFKPHSEPMDEPAWRSTNRWTSYAFVIGGLILVLTAFMPSGSQFPVFLTVVILVGLSPAISAYLYRQRVK
ncbi:DUF1648 domain-containing protein [Paenibacillus sp. GCM10023252]|uniref:DUF1648 domain-containing protein n=1 Tax=Paenibacillus sp. GCM10023252 TaxID=3252649 RepID=UPI003608F453